VGVAIPFCHDVAHYAHAAESYGFDYLTCGEHLAYHIPSPNSFISLAVAAGATTRIRLVSSVTLVPLYPPVLLSKLVASLDVATGGRFELGVGVGGEHPQDFDAVGISRAQRGDRTDEVLAVLNRLLTEDTVDFNGRYLRFEGVTLGIRPVQRPHVWICGRKRSAMVRAVRYGDVWMPYLYSPEQLASSVEELNRIAGSAGLGPWNRRSAIYLHAAVYPDSNNARRTGADAVGRLYRQDPAGLSRYLVAGSAPRCLARIREYVDAGASIIVLRLACPDDDVPLMFQRVAQEIIPAIRNC
jgi:alkanesulfonate monooxygenase SsuD/methylene tetrahydromethanopterin reductase-like flavin-dependent oxidoreductase (luciferase family)